MSSQITNKINFSLVSNKFFAATIITICPERKQNDKNETIIVPQIFITEIFKPQLFSSYATRLHTRLTEFFPNHRCLLCLDFYIAARQSNECTWRRMSLPSRHLYKCKQVACSVIVACLLVYPPFNYCTLLLSVYFLISFLQILMLLLLVYFFNSFFMPMVLL